MGESSQSPEEKADAERERAGRGSDRPGRFGVEAVTRWADRLGVDALGGISWRRKWVGGTRPWRVSASAYPRDGTLAEKAQFLLRYAVLAPSSHNTQPWLFTVADDEIRQFADLGRWLQVADPERRELYVSLGAALENLLVAADHFGVRYEVEYLPGSDQTHAATVRLSDESATSAGSSDERDTTVGLSDQRDTPVRSSDESEREPGERNSQLFEAIPRRRTTRGRYRKRPVPVDDLRTLGAATVEDDVRLQFVTDPDALEEIADLTARADRRLFADPAYRRELGRWIGRGAFGGSWPKAKLGKLLVTYLDLGRRQAREDRELLRHTPVVAVVRTRGDGRRAQLRAGQAFERASLRATALGLNTHPVSALLEVPALRRELTDLLGRPEWTPQHLFRLGYAIDSGGVGGEAPEPSPRRPVEAVLVD